MKKRLLLAAAALAFTSPAEALEFRTTARAAILYDAPSQFATKLAVAGVGVPFEIFVETDAWTKVRDATGRLAWLERSALGNAHTVMVNADDPALKANRLGLLATLHQTMNRVADLSKLAS